MDSAKRKELKCVKEQVLAVQRMQDYIEKNRTEDITLSELAGASLFSPWYSYRLFRAYLGLTPTEYIRKYRLTQAARQLCDGWTKVIDAAFDAGFSMDTTNALPVWGGRVFALLPVYWSFRKSLQLTYVPFFS